MRGLRAAANNALEPTAHLEESMLCAAAQRDPLGRSQHSVSRN